MQVRDWDKENVDTLAQLVISEFQSTLKLKLTCDIPYVPLAEIYAEIGEFRETEDSSQKVSHVKNIENHIQQEIHLRYGHFQQFHRKSEGKAIIRYLKGLKIEEKL